MNVISRRERPNSRSSFPSRQRPAGVRRPLDCNPAQTTLDLLILRSGRRPRLEGRRMPLQATSMPSIPRRALLPPGEGGPKGRMRALSVSAARRLLRTSAGR